MSIEQSVYEGMARRIESLEAQLAAVQMDTEWQPIETAPRDGTRVLLFGRGPYDDIEAFTGEFSFDRWLAAPNEASEYMPESCSPTHWIPLPEPPTSPRP